MATPDPFADIPVGPGGATAQAPADPFADIPVAVDPFADIPVMPDRRPPAAIAEAFSRMTAEQRQKAVSLAPGFTERREMLEHLPMEEKIAFFKKDSLQSDPLAGVVRGLGQTIRSALKAPGTAIEAARTADTGKPAELVWDDPSLIPGSLLMLGKKGIEKLDNFFYEEPTRQRTWYEQIPEATGSALAFIGAGAAGGIGAVGTAGAAVMGEEQYNDALANGADPDEALLAFVAGSVLGTSEAIPMSFFLNRLNKLTNGRLAQEIKEKGLNKISRSTLGETVRGFLVEAGQEGFQAVGSNFIARDVAGYDPARSLGENFWDNVLTGGAVGSLLGGGMGYLNKLNERDALEQLEALFQAARNEPINQIVGSFSDVSDRHRFMAMKAEVDKQMLADGAIALAEREGRPPGPIEPSLVHKKNLQQSYNQGEESTNPYTWWAMYGAGPIETAIETALPKSPLGTTMSIAEAVEKQPVVVSKTGLYETALERKAADIQYMENELKSLPEGTELHKDFSDTIKKARENRLVLLAKQKIEHQLLRHAKDIFAAYRNLIPNVRFILHDVEGPGGSSDNAGSMQFVRNVKLRDGTTTDIATVYLKLERLVDRSYVDRKTLTGSQPYARLKRRLFETISHEFGHAVASEMLNTVYEGAVSDPDPVKRKEFQQLFAFIEQDYVRHLRAVAKNNQDFIYLSSFALERGLSTERFWDDATNRASQDLLTVNRGESTIKETGQSLKDYYLSFDEYFAEQTSRLATQGRLDNGLLTKFFRPVLQQYKDAFEQFPEYAKNEYGGNWQKFLESRTLAWKISRAREAELATAKDGKGIFDALAGKLAGFPPEAFRGLREHLDSIGPYIKGLGYGVNLLQMVEMNPHIPALQFYRNGAVNWQNFQRAMGLGTMEGLIAWRKLGKGEASQLSNVFVEEQEAQRRFTPTELAKKLTVEAYKVYTTIRTQLDTVLEEMRAVALEDANRTFEQGTEIQKAEIAKVNTEFDRMKERGYFPSIRFGKYTITARATKDAVFQGENFKQGQLITFPVFESEKDRDLALATLRKELAGFATVSPSIMREDEFAIQGMPRAMLRALKNKLAAQGELTPSLEAAFDQALAQVAPFRNFRKQWLRKKGIHGASDDLMRSYAYYMRSAAGHIARVKFSEELLAAVTELQNDVEIVKRSGGPAQTRQEMVHWLRRHFDYIMNPAEELAALRGVGFVAYLGFMIKSATVNATQIVMVTYPYLAARYGDAAAVKELTRAGVLLKDWVTNKKAYLNAIPDAEGNVKKPDEARARRGKMIAELTKAGIIDQSLATELAIAASENNMDRGLHLPAGKRIWHEFSRFSALPFHLVEKMNRYLTAIASYELEYAKNKDHDRAVLTARHAVWTTQYENARWNRPEIFRGKKSVAFLFMNFVQNSLFFAVKDKGSRRYFMMMLLMAGVMGLPGAEDLEDVVDFTVTVLNRMLGLKNPKFQLRQEMREALLELGTNPDLILHGISQDSFGLGHVGELTGIPIPHFDLSGSIGLGNVIPGTKLPGLTLQRPSEAVLMEALGELGGAAGNLVEGFYRGIFSTEQDDWKRAERLLPLMSARSLSKAARLAARGKEQTAAGTVVAEFDPHDPRDAMTLAGVALGFQPTELTVGWERELAARDMMQYYNVQQTALQKQINWAYFQEDREAMADARKAIAEYNEQVPYPEMAMRPENIRNSIREYVKSQMVHEAGFAGQRKYERLLKGVQELYPDPYADSVRKEPSAEP